MLEEEKLGVNDQNVEPPSTNDSNTPQTEVEKVQPEQPAGSDISGSQKTYTEQELQDIIHKRTKGDSEKLRNYEAAVNQYKLLGSPEEIYKKLSSITQSAPTVNKEPEVKLSPEDERAKQYLLKLIPDLKNIGDINKKIADSDGISSFVREMVAERSMTSQAFVNSSRNELYKICDEIGIKDDSKKALVEEMVAGIIKSDANLARKFALRDMSCIAEAMSTFKSIGGFSTPATNNSSNADLAATKQKTAALTKQMPKGGSASAIRKTEKLSDDERLEAAFKAVKGGSGD